MSLTQFTSITGTCVPVLGPDMDTDRIIPARFLKCITFDELAGVMFWDERFDENGQSKSHPVDDPRFKGASIILGGSNFGCGSSREQAPGVLKALGVQAVIAKSFARIFFRNAINIGLPAIVCKDLPDDVQTGDTMELHMSDGTAVANGKTYTCTKLPEYMQGILNQGGLIASLNKEEK